ncbi:MAG: YoaP domain-containing protein [Calditrichaeota bacterium]|nr:YoaP domain-containing protein [Calditrichota bacterium]MCB9086851.1 YoaP domain-containing protein [Calditrichia bacterium]
MSGQEGTAGRPFCRGFPFPQVSTEKIRITSREEAQQAPTPFTIFSVYLHGKFLTHEMMGESKFSKTLQEALT